MAGRLSEDKPGMRVPSSVMSSLHSPLPAWVTWALLPLVSPVLGLSHKARKAARTPVWLAGRGAGETGGSWGNCQAGTKRSEIRGGLLWRCEELIHQALA